MNFLRQVVDRVRSRAGTIWKAVGPYAGRGVAGRAAVDIVLRRRELVIENAMLRHQIVILGRKSPHPRLTAFDRIRLLLAAAVLTTWRRTVALPIRPPPGRTEFLRPTAAGSGG